MRRIYQISMILLMAWLFTGLAIASDELQYRSNFLVSVYLKTQILRDQAIAEIRKIDTEIKKNEETIQKSLQIINLASQRTDANAKKAETIAREALMKAQEAKRKNEETKKEWELKKIKADRSYAVIQSMLSQNYGSNRQIKGFMTNYTGNVYIIKANGDQVSPENGFLEPGDKVWTGDGIADVQMLDGRATTQIGPYSELYLKKDTAYEQIAELVKGKIYMAIESLDEYEKKMKEVVEKYKKDIKTTKEWLDEYLKSLLNKRFKVNTPHAVIGVRGTKFVVEVKDIQSSELIVLEGSVEVGSLNGDKVVIVDEGYKVIATKNGIGDIEKITDIDRWWGK